MGLFSRYNKEATKRLMEAVTETENSPAAHNLVARNVADALAEGADPDAYERFPDGRTGGRYALWEACHGQHTEAAKLLLNAGADANCKSRLGSRHYETPLQAAVAFDKVDYTLLDTLIKHKANAEIVDREGRTLLHRICYNPEEEDRTNINPARLILDSIPKARRKAFLAITEPNTNFTSLHRAFNNCDFKRGQKEFRFIRALLEDGADINAKSTNRHTPPVMIGKQSDYNAKMITSYMDLLKNTGFNFKEAYSRPGDKSITLNFTDFAIICSDLNLLEASLNHGIEPTPYSIEQLRDKRVVDRNEREVALLLAQTGYDLCQRVPGPALSSQALVNETRVQEGFMHIQRSGHRGSMRLKDFIDPDKRFDLLAAISIITTAQEVFRPLYWTAHPEERRAAFLTLPPPMRAWLKEAKHELRQFEPSPFKQEPYRLLRDSGPFTLSDYVKDGQPSGQLLAWWQHVPFLANEECWKEGARDVVKMVTSLPEALQEGIDLSEKQREAKPAAGKSAVMRYVRAEAGWERS